MELDEEFGWADNNSEEIENEPVHEIIKFRAQHVATFYPKAPLTLGDEGHTWGIVKWAIINWESGEARRLNDVYYDSHTDDIPKFIVLKGHVYAPIDPKAIYNITAEYVVDQNYGPQYRPIFISEYIDFSQVKNQRAFLNSFLTPLQVEEFFKLYDKPLEVIASHDIEKMCKVHNVGKIVSQRIIDAYEAKKDYSDVYIELDKYGFSQALIDKLIKTYHQPAKIIDVVKNKPYSLVQQVDGIGFAKADDIAIRTGLVKMADVMRIKAFIVYYLKQQGELGHSYVYWSEMTANIIESLGGKSQVYEEYDNPEEHNGKTNNIAESLDQLVQEDEVRIDRSAGDSPSAMKIYLTSIWKLERDIAYHLKRLALAHNEFEVENFEEKIADAEKAQGFTFTDEQIEGIKLGLKEQVCFISGLAGSGKSSLVSGILAVLGDKYTFAQTALSGKAAARLQEVTGQDGMTIHRLLGYSNGSFAYNEENQLPYKIYILDEVSLVGGELFLRFLKAIPTGSKLYMLGDMGQLEAIGLLNLAADMFNSPYIPTVDLKQVHRQAQESGILMTAYEIRNQRQILSNNGQTGILAFGKNKDMLIDCNVDRTDNLAKVVEYYRRSYDGQIVKGDVNKIEVIAPVRERGTCSVYALNQEIQKLVNPVDGTRNYIYVKKSHLASDTDFSYYLQENDKIMCIKNNYNCQTVDGATTEIFNGWTGIIRKIDNKAGYADIEFTLSDEIVRLDIKDVKEQIVLGYACTCHKFQGDGCDVIIGVINYETPPFMLTCQLAYTMLTRAKKRCILVMENQALARAIHTNFVSEKRTFLPELLGIDFDILHAEHEKGIEAKKQKRRDAIEQVKKQYEEKHPQDKAEEVEDETEATLRKIIQSRKAQAIKEQKKEYTFKM